MEAHFWHQRWANNQIAFHQDKVNPLLVAQIDALSLSPGSRLFIPLCGKTLDIAWLIANGYRVVGAELSEIAIQQLFEELGMVPAVEASGEFILYRGDNLEVFVGDFFALTPEQLGSVDAVYDRAALVALPDTMRNTYTADLLRLTNSAPQLLLTIEYDQSQLKGPPFSVCGTEVARHYGHLYQLQLRATIDVEGGLKGRCPAVEKAWLLQTP